MMFPLLAKVQEIRYPHLLLVKAENKTKFSKEKSGKCTKILNTHKPVDLTLLLFQVYLNNTFIRHP